MDAYTLPDTSLSPSNSWPLDEFVQDPSYLAYQEELRCLIFNTAQTAAPSREGSPTPEFNGATEGDHEVQAVTKSALATGRRLAYLKNYVAEVAPWVSFTSTALDSLHSICTDTYIARYVR